MAVTVNVSGPLFSGQLERDVRRAVDEGIKDAAEHGRKLVRAQFEGSLKHPTGYLSSRVSVEKEGHAHWRVGDGGVVYGPWIEGVGSRNYPATRFRGYRSYRKAERDLEGQAVLIVREALARVL